MQLHTFKSPEKKRAQRIGRGGKRGTTAGRGTKGQKSRAGRRIRPAIRELISRLPKRRGFRNKPKLAKPIALSLERVAARAKTLAGGTTITPAVLKQLKLIPDSYKGAIKILSSKTISSPLIIEGIQVSQGARQSIEKAGGKVGEFAKTDRARKVKRAVLSKVSTPLDNKK